MLAPMDHEIEATMRAMGLLKDGERMVPLSEATPDMFPSAAELVAEGHGMVSVREAAEVLGLTVAGVLEAIDRGDLTARAVGNTALVSAASVRAFQQSACGPVSS